MRRLHSRETSGVTWDLYIQDMPEGLEHIDDLSRDHVGKVLGTRTEIARRIAAGGPAVTWRTASYGRISGARYTIDIDLGPDENVRTVVLMVRGENPAARVAGRIITALGYPAVDPMAPNGLFSTKQARKSLRTWNAIVRGTTPP